MMVAKTAKGKIVINNKHQQKLILKTLVTPSSQVVVMEKAANIQKGKACPESFFFSWICCPEKKSELKQMELHGYQRQTTPVEYCTTGRPLKFSRP